VPGQEPDAVFQSLEAHLAHMSPSLAPGLRCSAVRLNPGARAYKAPRHDAAFALVEEELTRLFGVPPVLERSGGSVNAFDEFHSILGIESISFGFGAQDSHQHAVDERMRLASIHAGQRAYVSLILNANALFSASLDPKDEL